VTALHQNTKTFVIEWHFHLKQISTFRAYLKEFIGKHDIPLLLNTWVEKSNKPINVGFSKGKPL